MIRRRPTSRKFAIRQWIPAFLAGLMIRLHCSFQPSCDVGLLRGIGSGIRRLPMLPSYHRCAFHLACAMILLEVFCLACSLCLGNERLIQTRSLKYRTGFPRPKLGPTHQPIFDKNENCRPPMVAVAPLCRGPSPVAARCEALTWCPSQIPMLSADGKPPTAIRPF